MGHNVSGTTWNPRAAPSPDRMEPPQESAAGGRKRRRRGGARNRRKLSSSSQQAPPSPEAAPPPPSSPPSKRRRKDGTGQATATPKRGSTSSLLDKVTCITWIIDWSSWVAESSVLSSRVESGGSSVALANFNEPSNCLLARKFDASANIYSWLCSLRCSMCWCAFQTSNSWWCFCVSKYTSLLKNMTNPGYCSNSCNISHLGEICAIWRIQQILWSG